MDGSLTKTIGLAAITAIMTVFVARADGGAAPGQAGEAAGTLAADSAVLHRDSAVTPKWLNDANVFALVATMNGRQIAAANVELSGWRSDTVRALATSLIHDHGELQHSADSLAAALHLAPVSSALNEEVLAAFQAQVDSVSAQRGGSLDRAFVRQQVNSHKMMATYLDQLRDVATSPELRAWLEGASARVASQLSQLGAQQRAFGVADSTAADSVARRQTARNRQPANR